VKRRAHGFTLVEVMVAVGILAMVTTLVWGSFRDTLRTKSAIEVQSARYRTVRIALERVAREISQAYLSQNEDTTQEFRRTFFIGKRRSDLDELRFSYFGHQRLYQDADECDTAQVAYFGARDREHNWVNLMRRETRRLANLRVEDAPGATDILCDDVVRLRFDYWDARDKQWRDEWATTSVDGQPDRLPAKVRITLVVHDERGKEVPFTTTTRVSMQEPLGQMGQDSTMFAPPAGQPGAKPPTGGPPPPPPQINLSTGRPNQ
jgi:general secretion pathway protein J